MPPKLHTEIGLLPEKPPLHSGSRPSSLNWARDSLVITPRMPHASAIYPTFMEEPMSNSLPKVKILLGRASRSSCFLRVSFVLLSRIFLFFEQDFVYKLLFSQRSLRLCGEMLFVFWLRLCCFVHFVTPRGAFLTAPKASPTKGRENTKFMLGPMQASSRPRPQEIRKPFRHPGRTSARLRSRADRRAFLSVSRRMISSLASFDTLPITSNTSA